MPRTGRKPTHDAKRLACFPDAATRRALVDAALALDVPLRRLVEALLEAHMAGSHRESVAHLVRAYQQRDQRDVEARLTAVSAAR